MIVHALRHLGDDTVAYDPMTDPKVINAIAQVDRGEVFEWNDALRADTRRQALEDMRSNKPIPDNLKY